MKAVAERDKYVVCSDCSYPKSLWYNAAEWDPPEKGDYEVTIAWYEWSSIDDRKVTHTYWNGEQWECSNKVLAWKYSSEPWRG